MGKREQPKLSILKKVCARIPTDVGEFLLCVYLNNQGDEENLALILGDIPKDRPPLVRVHSECLTGELFGSRRCDCGEQLNLALQKIAAEGQGILIYLRQEGRGIGLFDKLRAYNLQDQGYDTVEANLLLGHQPDERDYTMAALILRDLDIASVRLLTNNPEKIAALQQLGISVQARIPLVAAIHAENARYLFTKAQRMNHLLNLSLLQAYLPLDYDGNPE